MSGNVPAVEILYFRISLCIAVEIRERDTTLTGI